MIGAAEMDGRLKPGPHVEPTVGNTRIALAWVCAATISAQSVYARIEVADSGAIGEAFVAKPLLMPRQASIARPDFAGLALSLTNPETR